MTNKYFNIIFEIEKLHRLFLDCIKNKLININVYDINNVQCLILYKMGEKGIVNVGEFTEKGYYLGSNVSYNLRKLVENGYLFQKPCEYDKRQTLISITSKGKEIREKLEESLFSQLPSLFTKYSIEESDLDTMKQKFLTIEKILLEYK